MCKIRQAVLVNTANIWYTVGSMYRKEAVQLSEIHENQNERIYSQQIKGSYDPDRYSRATEVVPGAAGSDRHRRSSKYSTTSRQYAPSRRNDEPVREEKPARSRQLLPILMIAAAVILLIAAVWVLLPSDNALKTRIQGILTPGPAKPAAQVTEFKTTSEMHLTGTKILFSLTTTTNVDNVRLVDEERQEITATSQKISSDSDRAIWELTAVFEEEYAGLIYPVMFVNQKDWVESDTGVRLIVVKPTAVPTDVPLPTEPPYQPPETIAAVVVSATETPGPTDTAAAVTETPGAEEPTPGIVTQVPADAIINNTVPTAVPENAQPTDEPAPTEEPTAEPTDIPTPVPTTTPLTVGEIAARPDDIGLSESVFSGAKVQDDYKFDPPLYIQEADRYDYYENTGVLTFRGDNFRRNAATGTVEVTEGTLTLRWEFPLAGLRTADSGTLYGVGWNNQPAIVKWPQETREWMNLNESSKNMSAMREVIFSAQDGKVYFVNLETGEASRDVISIGFPMRGSVSVDPRHRPLITFGQAISKLPDKTGAIGYYVYSLLDQSRLYFINGRSNDNQKQYSNNGAFDGSSLIIYEGGRDQMVVAGENGLLYSVDLKGTFSYPRISNPDAKVSLTVTPSVIYNRCIVSGEKDARTSIESAVAMYANYVYTADGYGIIRCVDINTMKTLWAYDAGDNTDAAVALDLDGDSLSLYTGNTAALRLKKNEPVSIRRMDALTGKVIWTYEIVCEKNNDEYSGCKASPVIGQNDLSGLVYFTVNRVSGGGAKLIALNKADGTVAWEHSMAESVSSPVAVYNEAGNGWIIQADSKGAIYVLDGLTGYLNSTFNVDGRFEASPAVYKNLLVIGTCSRDPKMYCFEIK